MTQGGTLSRAEFASNDMENSDMVLPGLYVSRAGFTDDMNRARI